MLRRLRPIRKEDSPVTDLSHTSGIPVWLDESSRLVFGNQLQPVEPDVRTLDQARRVLWNMSVSEPHELYLMYRGIALPEHKALFRKHRIRYDITVIPAAKLGDEYMKTVGHYHPVASDSSMCYPEVYEVLFGRAHYLLQKADTTGLKVSDVLIVEAHPGDKVLIPPGYGHVTINPGREPLVMSNLIEREFKSVYAPMESAGGACYHEIEEDGMPVFVENDRYDEVPEPRLIEPKDIPQLGLKKEVPLYGSFCTEPDVFGYLVRPHMYDEALSEAMK